MSQKSRVGTNRLIRQASVDRNFLEFLAMPSISCAYCIAVRAKIGIRMDNPKVTRRVLDLTLKEERQIGSTKYHPGCQESLPVRRSHRLRQPENGFDGDL